MDWLKRIERRAPHSISYIRGTDVKVLRVIYLLASGWGFSDILREHPELCASDIRACLAYAGKTADNEYARREITPILIEEDSEESVGEDSAYEPTDIFSRRLT